MELIQLCITGMYSLDPFVLERKKTLSVIGSNFLCGHYKNSFPIETLFLEVTEFPVSSL